uniref:Phosphotransferase n=1 Tax=Neolamprologus brichardi TaxID=32507 RepID=A0A3Q4GUN9_NEOBR
MEPVKHCSRVCPEHHIVDVKGQFFLQNRSQLCSCKGSTQVYNHFRVSGQNTFLESHNLKGQTLPLGFTFSFPCEQLEIDKSILIRWTKGYNCSGVEGKDVVQLLKEAIQRRGDYHIGSVAMVNDTVGTMMSCGYRDQSCEIGMIIGTGTNACYMEEMTNVKGIEGEDGRMCINTEWGGFGDDKSLDDILTEFDVEVDKTSINPGVHIFEKMISGMYLGEIVRLVLVKMTKDKLLFKGQISEALGTPGQFETKAISEIEDGLENAMKILTELGLDWDPVDASVVRLVCDTISSRSAHLCAAALATLVNHIRNNRKLDHLKTTVGVDGTSVLIFFSPMSSAGLRRELLLGSTSRKLTEGLWKQNIKK